VTHPAPPSPKLWSSSLKAPFPTDRWFEDAVIPQIDRVNTTYTYTPNPSYGDGESPFTSFPYMLLARATGLVFALNPLTYAQRAPAGPWDPSSPTMIPGSIIVPPTEQWRLGAVEPLSGRIATAYDFMSVEITYSGSQSGTMVAPIVEGMPYVTTEYAGLTPVLTSESGIQSVNGSSSPGTVGPASRFLLTNAVNEQWVLYASSPITVTWTSASLQASSPFHGFLRAALVSSPMPASSPFVVQNDISVLDANWGAYPRSTTVDATIQGDTATVTFTYQTAGTGNLLMLALPHHMDRLSGATPVKGVSYPFTSGEMQAVQGNEWSLSYSLPTISYEAPRPIDPTKAAMIQASLKNDLDAIGLQIDGSVIIDPYDAFRRFAAMARLAQIADELGDSADGKAARQSLAPWPARWLENNWGNDFVYDTSWGGVVVQGGLKVADDYYYNGYYNDHHFHWGYMLYAAAVIAKQGTGDAAWLGANRHQEALTALARDIANPSPDDPYFPPFRMFDWFKGHSWTLGILHDYLGRDEESTSEAVNAWYALSLYGQAIGDSNMQNVGRILAGMEIAAAQEYWQIPTASTLYPSSFAPIGVADNQHSLITDFETYFGMQDEYMFGIQALPFTPITEELVNPQWMKDTWPTRLQPRLSDGADPLWVGYLYMLQSTYDPQSAWNLMMTAPPQSYLYGNSQTDTLWFLATRP
jgi:endo-1,3(4)-beta-glucanase